MLGWLELRPAGRFPRTPANRPNLAQNLDCPPIFAKKGKKCSRSYVEGACLSGVSEPYCAYKSKGLISYILSYLSLHSSAILLLIITPAYSRSVWPHVATRLG